MNAFSFSVPGHLQALGLIYFQVFSRFLEDCLLVAKAYLITSGSLEIRVS